MEITLPEINASRPSDTYQPMPNIEAEAMNAMHRAMRTGITPTRLYIGISQSLAMDDQMARYAMVDDTRFSRRYGARRRFAGLEVFVVDADSHCECA